MSISAPSVIVDEATKGMVTPSTTYGNGGPTRSVVTMLNVTIRLKMPRMLNLASMKQALDGQNFLGFSISTL